MRNKYDQAQDQDMPIVERVLEVAEHHGVPMAQVALAWHWAKGVTVLSRGLFAARTRG